MMLSIHIPLPMLAGGLYARHRDGMGWHCRAFHCTRIRDLPAHGSVP
jgi:hypothetical protein